MGLLLQDMGQLEEARPLYEEALQARRETLGDRHPNTLVSISGMGTLLYTTQTAGGEAAVRRVHSHMRRVHMRGVNETLRSVSDWQCA